MPKDDKKDYKSDFPEEKTAPHKIQPRLANGLKNVPDSARVIYSEEPNPNDG